MEVIVQFALDHKLPPLTCLAVNDSGLPGDSYAPVNGSWQADMEAVARFNWSEWQDRWDKHIQAVRTAAIPLKRRTEQKALEIVHQAYLAGRLPKLAPAVKDQLVKLLKDGLAVDDAIQQLDIAANLR